MIATLCHVFGSIRIYNLGVGGGKDFVIETNNRTILFTFPTHTDTRQKITSTRQEMFQCYIKTHYMMIGKQDSTAYYLIKKLGWYIIIKVSVYKYSFIIFFFKSCF